MDVEWPANESFLSKDTFKTDGHAGRMKWTHGEYRPNAGLVEVDGQNRTDYGYIYFDATEGKDVIFSHLGLFRRHRDFTKIFDISS